MATLSRYKALLSEKIGTSSIAFYTAEMRVNAINSALDNLGSQYDIPELVKRATLTFASGSCAIPTDYFRMVKLWDPTNSEIEYEYIVPDLFDRLDATASNYWTEDYSTVTSERRLFIKPTTVTSVYSRYVIPIPVLNTDTDESGIKPNWDEAVTYSAAAYLLENAKDLQKAQAMNIQANAAAARAYGAVKNVGGVKGNVRLHSRFEKFSILSNDHI